MNTRLKRQRAADRFVANYRAAERASSADLVALAPDRSDGLKLGTLDGHLGYFLRRLQVTVFKDFIRTLAPMDVRPAQYSVLLLIEANPGRSQAAIGQALDIERARLARMLHVLEGRGWIERRAANGDGRSHSLYLTRAGEKALVRIKALAARHEAWLAEILGSKRRLQLMEHLKEFG
jgi:DNA-binding MarR family transcriptional regulator